MKSLWKAWQWYWFDRRMKKQWKKMVEDCKPVECPPETEMSIFAEPFTKIISKGNAGPPLVETEWPPTPLCGWCWGSHGCDLYEGHEGTIHRCGEPALDDTGCSEYNSETRQARYVLADVYEDDPRTGYNHEWSEWKDHSHGFNVNDMELPKFEELNPS